MITYKFINDHLQILKGSSTDALRITYRCSKDHLQILEGSPTDPWWMNYRSSKDHLQILQGSPTDPPSIILLSSKDHLKIPWEVSWDFLRIFLRYPKDSDLQYITDSYLSGHSLHMAASICLLFNCHSSPVGMTPDHGTQGWRFKPQARNTIIQVNITQVSTSK